MPETPIDHDEPSTDSDSGGEVSEVGRMADAGDPISDSQSVAGSPSEESGDVDEGPTGPNSRGGSNQN